jgi:class 3 adenylate cyclase
VVTFLMTDVVGSTRLWEQDPGTMRTALARHDELMADTVEAHRGVLLRERGEGDSTFSVFGRATDGTAAAIAAQAALRGEPWPEHCFISVRMAVHTGEASERDGDYYGRPVNRVARLRAIAEGGQILVSKSTAEIVLDHLPDSVALTEMGLVELKDMDRPEMVYVLAERRPPDLKVQPREAPEAEAAAGWEAVVTVDPASALEHHPQAAPAPARRPEVVFPLTAPRVLIGRRSTVMAISPDIDLSGDLEDPGVSRVHAILERLADGSYELIDPGSTNGTFLNGSGEPIPSAEPIPLRTGDTIAVGAWTRISIRAAP